MPYQGRLPYAYKSPFNTTLDQGTQTVPSLAFLGDTNNGVFSPATDNVAITTNGVERLRVTDTGNFCIGISAPVISGERFTLYGSGGPNSSISTFGISDDPATSSGVRQSRSRANSSPVQQGDILGVNLWRGWSGTAYRNSARIFTIVDGDVTTTSVPGALVFETTSANASGQTEKMRISREGNVGIGTNNPTAKFHLNALTGAYGTAFAKFEDSWSVASLKFTNPGVGGTFGLQAYASDNPSTYTPLVLNSSGGNVGIGTTNPTTKLSVYSSGTLASFTSTGTYGDIILTNAYAGGTVHYIGCYDASLRFYANSGSVPTMTISGGSPGNVGIGTINPISTLHVQGTFRSAISSGAGGDTLLGAIIGVSNGYLINANSSNNITHTWHTGSNDAALRINNDGNVGIGTTNPLDKLHVSGGNIRTVGGYLTMFGVASPNHENYIQMSANGVSYIGVGPETNPTIKFKVGNTSTTVLNVSSTAVTPGTDNTYNLGSSTFRWANIYSADLQLSNEGSSNDVDGTWGQYTIQEGENDLFLLNRRNGKKYKFVLQEVN